MAYNKTMFEKGNYEYFYFEIRMKTGKLVATFQARWMAEKFMEEYGRNVDLTMTEIKQIYNTKENNEHYKGKIWVTKGRTRGCNICADVGKEELMVIAFVPEITEEVVEEEIRSFGWNPEKWLREEA